MGRGIIGRGGRLIDDENGDERMKKKMRLERIGETLDFG